MLKAAMLSGFFFAAIKALQYLTKHKLKTIASECAIS
jgi:hypothetical protein